MYIGFDYGTSNCAVGSVVKGEITQLHLEPDQLYLPSLVAADSRESVSEHLFRFFEVQPSQSQGTQWLQRAIAANKRNDIDVEENSLHFGSAALEKYLADPEFTYYVKSPKSFLGAGGLQETQIAFFEDLVCSMMCHIKAKAEYILQDTITETVIGRPVHFQGTNAATADTQAIGILESAAKRCGFKSVEFLLEPLAAGYHFEQQLTIDKKVLVIDIGGGTTDCTFMLMGPSFAKDNDRFNNILGYSGSRVGGNDFDIHLAFHRLMPLLGKNGMKKNSIELPSSQFWNAVSINNVAEQAAFYEKNNLEKLQQLARDALDPAPLRNLIKLYQERLSYRFVRDAELAKTSLSSIEETILDFHYLQTGLNATIIRQDLEQAIESPLSKIQSLIKETVSMANTTPDIVFITGGSGRSPFLRQVLQSQLPSSEIITGDYFGSVTRGLTLWAHTLFGNDDL